ncbi:MAG: right-handed parallel beta-helix repeat-containing protein, partial [Melioribacteraceae bacterium]|nr:right-handed parallel beta-helix repeat-containing protein [Melioribacteraceae bacterium]
MILILILLTNYSFSQINSSPSKLLYPMNEILIGTENMSGNVPTFAIEAVSQVWDQILPSSNPILLSDDYQYSTYAPPSNNQPMGSWGGFDFCNSGGDFGYGLYKLYVEGSPNNYILLDYRDDNYGNYDPFIDAPQDIWIKCIQGTLGNYYFYWSPSMLNPEWNSGDVEIWTAKSQSGPSTAKFEPYAPESLAISLSNGKPLLNWEHHSPAEDYWIGYKIYRCITVDNEPPTNYEEIAEVGKNITSYLDNNLCFANWKNIHYKVKTINTSEDSEFSNSVQINLTEEIINCNLTFSNDITVPSGKTLTVSPNVNLTFASGKKLIVNGTLSAMGNSTNSITFNRSGSSGTWGGIQFNSSSTGSLNYCTITYATHGVYCYNSSPTIWNSTLDNNETGLRLNYYSSPQLIQNNFRYNSTYGISCYTNCSPDLTASGYPGSNVIRNNSIGINSVYNSNPIAHGYMTYGNSIFDNTTYNIQAYYGCTIYAQRVFWNGNTKISTYQSTVDASNPLTTNPNPNRSSIEKSEPTQILSKMDSVNTDQPQDELTEALNKQSEKKYDEAITLFLEVFKKNKEELVGKYALTKMEECFTQSGRKDYLSFSDKEIKPNIIVGNETYVIALELEAHQMVN